jgi:hypothetical protein
MELGPLFEAVDAKPFRPFGIDIISGRQISVSHPDNILILPNRQNVRMILMFRTDPWESAPIWPEGSPDGSWPAMATGTGTRRSC